MNQAHYNRARLSPDQVDSIICAFDGGASKRQLARDYGLALSTVKRLLRGRMRQIG